jgi:hypothetical protein
LAADDSEGFDTAPSTPGGFFSYNLNAIFTDFLGQVFLKMIDCKMFLEQKFWVNEDGSKGI